MKTLELAYIAAQYDYRLGLVEWHTVCAAREAWQQSTTASLSQALGAMA